METINEDYLLCLFPHTDSRVSEFSQRDVGFLLIDCVYIMFEGKLAIQVKKINILMPSH
jgi:hypothetical protein